MKLIHQPPVPLAAIAERWKQLCLTDAGWQVVYWCAGIGWADGRNAHHRRNSSTHKSAKVIYDTLTALDPTVTPQEIRALLGPRWINILACDLCEKELSPLVEIDVHHDLPICVCANCCARMRGLFFSTHVGDAAALERRVVQDIIGRAGEDIYEGQVVVWDKATDVLRPLYIGK